MISVQTRLEVADNTGVKEVMCIKVLGSSKRRYAYAGDVIVVSAKSVTPQSKIKKGEVLRAVIVRTAQPMQRPDGSTISSDRNAVVLVNKQNEPIGSRVFGVIFRELRNFGKFMKLLSLAPEVL